jgi:hypothetical protein
MLGFLGLMSLLGFQYFYTGEWLNLLWFTWVIWFKYFLPPESK